MRNSFLVFTLFAVIAAVVARSPYDRNRPQKHSIHIRQSHRPAYFDSELDWAYSNRPHRQKLNRKELLMEAIKHIVKSGRLREHEVVNNVFHSYSPHRPNRLPKPIRNQLLESILSHWKEPIKPLEPTVIDMIEQEPSIVVETDPDFSKPPEPFIVVEQSPGFSKPPEPIIDPPALPNPDEPVVIVPIEPISDEPQGIAVIPPSLEPISEPIEIIQPEPIEIIRPEPIVPAVIDEEQTMAVPNPIEDISAIIKNQADQQPTKSASTVLVELISQLSASLGQLVGVIDQAVDKGTISDSMVGEIDRLIPGALVDVDQIASMAGQIDKSERK